MRFRNESRLRVRILKIVERYMKGDVTTVTKRMMTTM